MFRHIRNLHKLETYTKQNIKYCLYMDQLKAHKSTSCIANHFRLLTVSAYQQFQTPSTPMGQWKPFQLKLPSMGKMGEYMRKKQSSQVPRNWAP